MCISIGIMKLPVVREIFRIDATWVQGIQLIFTTFLEASRPAVSGGALGMQPRMSSRMQDTMSKLLALAGDHAEKIRGYGNYWFCWSPSSPEKHRQK